MLLILIFILESLSFIMLLCNKIGLQVVSGWNMEGGWEINLWFEGLTYPQEALTSLVQHAQCGRSTQSGVWDICDSSLGVNTEKHSLHQ